MIGQAARNVRLAAGSISMCFIQNKAFALRVAVISSANGAVHHASWDWAGG
jgi:hypothetical protein